MDAKVKELNQLLNAVKEMINSITKEENVTRTK